VSEKGTKLRIQSGGTLVPGRDIYIVRPEDDELLELLRRGEYCNVLTSRQMGKSSLMAQTARRLLEHNIKSFSIDMAGDLGTPATAEEWYIGLTSAIGRGLKLGLEVEEWWQGLGSRPNNQKLLEFFSDKVIPSVASPLVLFLDEIDSTLKLDFRDDLFTAIRAMYNRRPMSPEFEKLTFCFLGVTTPNELIKDSRTTPYNVGKPVLLRDFEIDRDDLSLLSDALSAVSGDGEAVLRKVLEWTGGHPFLTLRLCEELAGRAAVLPDEVDRLVGSLFADFDTVRSEVHFQYVSDFLTKRSSDPLATLALYRNIRRGAEVQDESRDAHVQLKLSGIVKRDERSVLVVRNRIYSRVFNESWVNDALRPAREQTPVASGHVFISHSSKDAAFVEELRGALEALGLPVWLDSGEPSSGEKLAPEVEQAIQGARQFVAVLGPNAFNSPWVRKETQKALEVEAARKGEGYRVIPLLLPGVEPAALPRWLDDEPIGESVKVTKAGGLAEALPDILAALGERLPADLLGVKQVTTAPVEDLTLILRDLRVEIRDGVPRERATGHLIYEPGDRNARSIMGRPFLFTSPLGHIEAEELRWYLEEYFVWPVGIFRERAERIEAQLPEWGQSLYKSALAPAAAQEALAAWQQAGAGAERRFSIFVERELPEGASKEEQASADEAAAELLALPWELLHDARSFLFHGKHPVRVRRRLPNRHPQPVRPTRLPIRILLVSPRPEEEGVSYIDHRISARPLVDAVESLGALARLSVLTPPTFGALQDALKSADEAGEPYDVVHFDGHGIYDRRVGLGGLCFEDPKDVEKLTERSMELIHAERLAGVVRDYRVPLVFLEACQSAKTEADPTASVAARLLEEGVTSVVAMSHSVLVETARRFVGAFYHELARGRRVGSAMIEGQRELERDTLRGRMMGAGELRLQDWFVPVLYQEEQDPQLVSRLPPEHVRQLENEKRRLSLGDLPEPPPHEFVGRSRELLALERLLQAEPWAVIRGQGGQGKTTLAAELARWLVRTGRHARASFVSLEQYTDARGVLDSLGRQLLPEGDAYSVANYPDLKQALQPVERALRDSSTLIVLDNLESVLPDSAGRLPTGAGGVEELFDLCRKLLGASTPTRLVFTTREPLPAPFDDRRREIPLGALSREDAIRLVGEVMKRGGLEPKTDDPGQEPQEIVELVEAVGRHARALVLLAREIAQQGVRATTQNLQQLMEGLHKKFPGDRENSLYASLELSLRRLPTMWRERAKALALFHGGAHLFVLGRVLGVEAEEVKELARQLIEVGLAQAMGDGHLRLDPALPSYLLREMGKTEREALRGRWAGAMAGLTAFLYQQQYKDAGLGARLTLLELPNLLAMLRWAEEQATPEEAVELSSSIEQLLSGLGQSQALAVATIKREQAAQRLPKWGHARFAASNSEVERLLDRGELQAALVAAERLLKRCLEAGEEAYPEAANDLSTAYFAMSRALKLAGAPGEALSLLREAHRRIEPLAMNGETFAAQLTVAVLSDSGDCLMALGRLDEAAAAYEESGRRAEALGHQRGAAVAKGQLGTIRLFQRRYKEALAAHENARQTFESLGEPRSVAIAWHLIGMVHHEAGQYEQAERAHRQSLAISVQQRDPMGEANSLNQLGILYDVMGRLEEGVTCYRQAADLYVRLQDQNKEGVVRNNLANTLLKLGRHEEARRELLRALACKEPYGHAAVPWKTWDILQELELTVGDAESATRAWHRAYESYLAYRKEGGYGATPAARLCTAAAKAIAAGDISELEQYLSQPLGEDTQPWARTLFPKVLAVLRGARDRALALDTKLDYDAAVELMLLLEELGKG
jgi:tetratricopeptide (TPR) repeat protein